MFVLEIVKNSKSGVLLWRLCQNSSDWLHHSFTFHTTFYLKLLIFECAQYLFVQRQDIVLTGKWSFHPGTVHWPVTTHLSPQFRVVLDYVLLLAHESLLHVGCEPYGHWEKTWLPVSSIQTVCGLPAKVISQHLAGFILSLLQYGFKAPTFGNWNKISKEDFVQRLNSEVKCAASLKHWIKSYISFLQQNRTWHPRLPCLSFLWLKNAWYLRQLRI